MDCTTRTGGLSGNLSPSKTGREGNVEKAIFTYQLIKADFVTISVVACDLQGIPKNVRHSIVYKK